MAAQGLTHLLEHCASLGHTARGEGMAWGHVIALQSKDMGIQTCLQMTGGRRRWHQCLRVSELGRVCPSADTTGTGEDGKQKGKRHSLNSAFCVFVR